jgi:transposase
MMLVYDVKSKDAKLDYHGNVDGEIFMKWFCKLLDKMDKTGKKYIIVMDNASYHSVNEAPPLNKKKRELYDWLEEEKKRGEAVTLKPFDEMRLWEIKKIITLLKTKNNYYKVDIEAKKRGHKVLRLPPYNCDLNPIEGVWKDIKHEVRKLNVNQNIKEVQKIAEKVMMDYTKEQWLAHENHVRQ